MDIKYNIIKKTKLILLSIGECFECLGKVYMKINCNSVKECEINALCLNDGYGKMLSIPGLSVNLVDNVVLSDSL
jgi:hypothetical protein